MDEKVVLVGSRLARSLHRSDRSQAEVAKEIGVTEPTLSRWKSKETSVRRSQAEALAAALGCSLKDVARDALLRILVPHHVAALPLAMLVAHKGLHAWPDVREERPSQPVNGTAALAQLREDAADVTAGFELLPSQEGITPIGFLARMQHPVRLVARASVAERILERKELEANLRTRIAEHGHVSANYVDQVLLRRQGDELGILKKVVTGPDFPDEERSFAKIRSWLNLHQYALGLWWEPEATVVRLSTQGDGEGRFVDVLDVLEEREGAGVDASVRLGLRHAEFRYALFARKSTPRSLVFELLNRLHAVCESWAAVRNTSTQLPATTAVAPLTEAIETHYEKMEPAVHEAVTQRFVERWRAVTFEVQPTLNAWNMNDA